MLTTILTLTLLSGSPESLKLHPVLSGAMPKVGFYVPQRLELSDKQPDTFKNVPTGAALFGTWEFGGKNYPTVEVDKDGKPVSIEMDLSGKGDFSGALVTPWKGRPTDPDLAPRRHCQWGHIPPVLTVVLSHPDQTVVRSRPEQGCLDG